MQGLPGELSQRGLSLDLEAELSATLRNLRDGMDDEPREDDAQSTQPQEKRLAGSQRVHLLRVREVATVTRVATVEDWDKIKERLDTRVRELLSQGLQVELN